MEIPANYQTVMPYLILQHAAAFLAFTQQVFGAVETHKSMRDEHTIMHAEIMIGGSTIMVADSTDAYPPKPASFFIYVEDADATYQKAIGAGATIVAGVADQPYGRSGGITDAFGNTWWITSHR